MFTGIIETIGVVHEVVQQGKNKTFWISSDLTPNLKIDQSVAHNGACLTVIDFKDDMYAVTAIDETLGKTNLNNLEKGSLVNLERCMLSNGRFDGHMVYGHVDGTGVCESVIEQDGSYVYTFRFLDEFKNLLVEKGSVTINGISLTIFDVSNSSFKVAIIPYTFEHTNIKTVKAESSVNLEYDILGKYVAKLIGNSK